MRDDRVQPYHLRSLDSLGEVHVYPAHLVAVATTSNRPVIAASLLNNRVDVKFETRLRLSMHFLDATFIMPIVHGDNPQQVKHFLQVVRKLKMGYFGHEQSRQSFISK